MLHNYIKSKLGNTDRALYDLTLQGQRIDHPYYHSLQHAVSHLRNSIRDTREDKLARRFEIYGKVTGAWARDMMYNLNRALESPNRVDSIPSGEAISVEIECIFPLSSNSECIRQFKDFCKREALRLQVQFKTDGSVHADGDDFECNCGAEDPDSCGCPQDEGREIVVTFSRYDSKALKLVCRELARLGVYVNKSCGLHVHFDMRSKDTKEINGYIKRLGAVVPLLKRMLPESRRSNTYCHLDAAGIRGRDRYAFVNGTAYRRHGTIEVRGHSGTISYDKIMSWVELMERIMHHKRVIKTPNFCEMLAQLECPRDLYDYCKSRFLKFGGDILEGLATSTEPPQDIEIDRTESTLTQGVA